MPPKRKRKVSARAKRAARIAAIEDQTLDALKRRAAVLVANGEDERNTVAWRDLKAEARELRFQRAMRGDPSYVDVEI